MSASRERRQMDAVFAACNDATTKAIRAAGRGSDAKVAAYLAASINVADLIDVLGRIDQGEDLADTR